MPILRSGTSSSPDARCWSRRDLLAALLRGGASALAAPSFVQLLAAPALAADGSLASAARRRKLVLLWLEGGPSQIDTFDPKPAMPELSPLKTLPTDVAGWEMSEYLPGLARRAGRLAVVRTVTSREGTHQRARELLHAGWAPNPSVRYPSLGSIVAHELGDHALGMPAFVQIGGAAPQSGELGARSDAFWVEQAGSKIDYLPAGGAPGGPRAAMRDALRRAIDAEFRRNGGGEAIDRSEAQRQRALDLMDSELLARFDLSQESEARRDAYGRNPFGEGVLLARRLVESGVAAVEVALPGWDTHSGNFERTGELCRQLDPAFSALLDDLAERGLLDETLVVAMGEFGRTPRLTGTDGRGHWARNFCAVLAGGGARPGTVVGTTDERSENIVERPVHVRDLFATFAALLGFDGSREYVAASERTIQLVDPEGKVVTELLAG